MTGNKPLISVIIPAYNCEAYIESCISSLIKQSYDNIEIIVVNDGSKDKTLKICRKLSNRDKRIIVIDKENSGVAAARNAGLNEINGEYCTFVDSDDYVDSKFIEKLITLVISRNADIGVCGFVDENEQGVPFHQSEIFIEEEYFISGFTKKNFVPYVCWQMIFKSALLNKKIPSIRFNENFSIKEDMLFINDLMVVSNKVAVIPDVLYHSVSRKGSLTDGLYNVSSWNKYKSSIYVYEYALNNSAQVRSLQKKVCYETLKEIAHMQNHMLKNRIKDEETYEYLRYLKKMAIKVFKQHKWGAKDQIILLMLIKAPQLYCTLKK